MGKVGTGGCLVWTSSLTRKKVEQDICFNFLTSNNQAEYETLIPRFYLAQELGFNRLKCQSDSQLVTSQVTREYQSKKPFLQKYYHIVENLTTYFNKFVIAHVLRATNDLYILSKLANTKKARQHKTLIKETLSTPSWDYEDVLQINFPKVTWITLIIRYLVDVVLPLEPGEARKLCRQASFYTMCNEELFR